MELGLSMQQQKPVTSTMLMLVVTNVVSKKMTKISFPDTIVLAVGVHVMNALVTWKKG